MSLEQIHKEIAKAKYKARLKKYNEHNKKAEEKRMLRDARNRNGFLVNKQATAKEI